MGEGWDNSVNLNSEFKKSNKKEMGNLKKYKMLTSRFRMFGSPDTITPENATDEKIEAILKVNPQFSKFFQLIEKPAKAESILETKLEEIAIAVIEETHIDSSKFEAPKLSKITKKRGGRLPKKTN
jgi:hypothetical protein